MWQRQLAAAFMIGICAFLTADIGGVCSVCTILSESMGPISTN